ncbi:MAG: hypothetical protein MZW92_56250 [Comamonadaceae bacterium]|nr:hypothetical protein [Comamonadaceae bacterium]
MVFGDPRDTLPFALRDYPSRGVALTPDNLAPAVLASCSIPFWLDAVHDVPGAPRGAYWDGGITDYHLHLDYAAMGDGLVLYPHFQPQVVPGWLDKSLEAPPPRDARCWTTSSCSRRRPSGCARCRNGKLPDRRRLQGLRRRSARPHRAPGARAGRREPATGRRVRRPRRLGPPARPRCRWPEAGRRAGLKSALRSTLSKDEKGITGYDTADYARTPPRL